MRQACVLIADISGSTRLYEERGNTHALGSIDQVLGEMHGLIKRAGGVFVHSKGDDILAHFPNPESAFVAVQAIVSKQWDSELTVHAGMSFGTFVEMDGDIFGKPVNAAARLAAKAKPGELLMDELCQLELCTESRGQLQSIGELALKGVDQPREVFSFTTQGHSPKTQFVPLSGRAPVEVGVSVVSGGKTWRLELGRSLIVGRAPECGIVLGQAWVSRLHGTFSVEGGLVEYKDHSSMGSLVELESGEEVLLHRNKMLLTGEGVIYAGVTDQARALASISFRVD